MNKELIKKYFIEFNHWLENGNVLYKHKNSLAWWSTDCWNYSLDYVIAIIINDKFVEFRKAIAEGKTVQYNFGNYGPNKQDFHDVWRDLDLSIGILSEKASPENYRIKPELDIKVGDWLFDVHYKTYDRVKDVFTHTVLLQSSLTIFKDAIENGYFKIWKPKVGEWCIMDDESTPNMGSFVIQKWQENSKFTPIPYTGPLPYFIKEQ